MEIRRPPISRFRDLDDVVIASFSAGQAAVWDGNQLEGSALVSSFNGRDGDVELESGDVSLALGYTPANAAAVVSSFNTRQGAVTLSSADVTAALGFTPANKAGDTFTGAVNVTANILLDNNFGFRIKDNAGNSVATLNMTSSNNLGINTSSVSGSIQINVANAAGRIAFLINSVEKLDLTNSGLLAFGANASLATVPALKPNATALEVKLGNDSAYTQLSAGNVLIGAGTAISGTNAMNLFASSAGTKPALRYLSTGSGTGKWQYSNDGTTFIDMGGGGGGSGATTALDNLAAVAINTSLMSDTDATDDLGSGAIKWKDGHFAGEVTADKFKTSGPYLMASAGNGNTLAVIAGDFSTYRAIIAASYRFGADDGGAADAMLSRIDAGVIGIQGVLEFGQVASLGTVSGNSGRMGVKDVAGTAEVFAKDEAGNEVQLTAHAFDGPDWLYDADDPLPQVLKETNYYLGIVRWTNKSRQARLLERLLAGEDIAALPIEARTFIHTENLPTDLIEDWDQNQDEFRTHREAQHSKWLEQKKAHEVLVEAYEALPDGEKADSQKPIPFTKPEPEPHTHKEIPGWLAERLARRDETGQLSISESKK